MILYWTMVTQCFRKEGGGWEGGEDGDDREWIREDWIWESDGTIVN